jgi:hypothetical protein
MKERLIEFLAYLGLGQTKFEERVGLARGFVNTLKDNMTLKSLKKITDAYPELNEVWLKTGEGEMLKSKTQIDRNLIIENADNITIPKSVLAILEMQAKTLESQQRTIEKLSLYITGKQGIADAV